MKTVKFELKMTFTREYPEEDVFVEDVRADLTALIDAAHAEAQSLGMLPGPTKTKWLSDKGFASETIKSGEVTGEEKK